MEVQAHLARTSSSRSFTFEPCSSQPRRCGRSRLACRAQQRSYSNPLGVHALVWTGGWSEEDCRKAVAGTKAAGYNLIEVPMLEPEQVDAAMTKRILEEHGIAATASLGLRAGADVNSEDGEEVAAGKALLFDALAAVAGFGGSLMGGPVYSRLYKYPGPATPAARANAIAAMRELAVRAADVGVVVALEIINRYETNLFNTAQQGMEFLSDINHDNVVIHLDTYHMNIEENSMQQAVAACGDRLGYVHIGESHRGYLGTGSVDFPGLFNALAAARYRGPLTFESFSSSVVSPALSNNLAVWRNLWESSEDLATHAAGFMDAHWSAARRAEGLQLPQ